MILERQRVDLLPHLDSCDGLGPETRGVVMLGSLRGAR